MNTECVGQQLYYNVCDNLDDEDQTDESFTVTSTEMYSFNRETSEPVVSGQSETGVRFYRVRLAYCYTEAQRTIELQRRAALNK